METTNDVFKALGPTRYTLDKNVFDECFTFFMKELVKDKEATSIQTTLPLGSNYAIKNFHCDNNKIAALYEPQSADMPVIFEVYFTVDDGRSSESILIDVGFVKGGAIK